MPVCFTSLLLRAVPYGHPDVTAMVEEVQDEYRRRYGGDGDTAPVDPSQFAAPHGWFVLGYADGQPVAMGGWRTLGPEVKAPGERPAEIKRMYVRPAARGRGLSRLVLTALEDSARAAGRDWLVLETGYAQPEALGLYHSSGYIDVPDFGYYAGEPGAFHLGKRL
ncbi:MAG: GNAT family N-acetyltransferase [Actinomycetota bacterium]|nr:GNAT family N-acetyltransferase [Actinomycetota bacterium]